MARFKGIPVEETTGGRFGGVLVENTEEEKNQGDRTWGEFGKDVALSAVQGVDMLAKLPAMAYDKATTGDWYGPETQKISAMSDEREKLKSAESQRKNKEKYEIATAAGEAASEFVGGGNLGTAAQVAAEFGTSFWESLKDPASIPEFVAQQAAQLGVMGKVGRGAEGLAQAAAKAAPRIAATKAGQAAVAGSGTAGAVAFGAGLQGVDVGSDTMQRLMALPEELWAKNPEYVALAEKVGADAAKQSIASRLAEEATLKAAAVSAATAALPGGSSIERALVGKVGGGYKAIPRAFAGEAAQEGTEEGTGKYFGNTSVQEINPEQAAFEGVGIAAGQGSYMGGVMGGGFSAAPVLANAVKNFDSVKPADQPSPTAVTGETGVTGGAQQAAQPQQTAAEQALYQPKSLTALDRVNEIDTERAKLQARMQELADPANGYGEMFDQERQEIVGQMAQMDLEREDITKTWPNAVKGVPTSFSTEAGARIEGQYALMEADDLNTSHDSSLRPNPNYPQELQPRERDRAASEMQIAGIVQKLDPARLGVSADAATGAPIVGADGLVESGNARTIALKRVYAVPGQKAEDYKSYLKANAEQFGLTQEAIDGMAKPVLVRVRATPVNRAEFARQANASTVAQMSTGEQAKADAARLDVLEDLRPDDNGDFSTSRDFIRRFMAKLPMTEQASMIDAAGNLSQAGYARIRNAILAKAYGESPVLQRMTESMDDNLRNISKALVKVAPDIAKARQAIAEGTMHNADLTPDLLAAIESISTLRSEGTSVAQELSQASMFGDKYSPETRELMEFLDQNIRSPRKMADFLKNITEALAAAGNPNQSSMFGDSAPGKGDLINFAKGQQNGRENAPAYSTAGEDRGQSGAEAGNQEGDQANRQAAKQGTGDWVAFPKDTGTLGIPRAEMPQIKSGDRSAFIQFLQARGVSNERVELEADDIKPTQAEYSPSKTERWVDTGDSDRSVLISSDGYVLDGHHQWMAAHMTGDKVQAIRLDAPIRRLLNLAYQFPSVQRSAGASGSDLEALRATAEDDFKAAMADLGAILRKHSGARMIREEDYPDLVPTLTRLFGAAFRIVGYDMKKAAAHVRDELKKNPTLKKIANFIKRETMVKAAQAALANPQDGETGQADLFSQPVRPEKGVTPDLFSQPAPAAKKKATIKIDGQEYDLDAPNFGVEFPKTLPDDHELLTETLDKATVMWEGKEQPRSVMHQAIIDKHFAGVTPATGQKIAYVMGGGGASGKGSVKNMLIEQGAIDGSNAVSLDPDDIKQDIPEYKEIIKAKDSRAAATVHEESSDLAKRIKKQAIEGGYNLVLDVTLGDAKKGEQYLRELKDAGYEVRLFGVTVEPAHAVVRAVERAKKTDRWVPLDHLLLAHKGFNGAFERYAKIADDVRLFDNTTDRKELASMSNGELVISDREAYNEIEERSQINEQASTIREIRSGSGLSGRGQSPQSGLRPKELDEYRGVLDARRAEGESGSVRGEAEGRSGGRVQGRQESGLGEVNENGDGTTGAVGAEGKGTDAAQGATGKRATQSVREGTGGRDRGLRGDADAGDRAQAGQGQGQDAGREGRDSENVGSAGKRAGAGRNAGVPAGRDIPLKSGRNYQFGPDDLTYEGSWQKKATQNVEAVELVKKLESENRLATPEEQKILAKFIGWGASEIANSIFGDKLDKQLRAIASYERVMAEFDRLGRNQMNKGGRWRGDYADSGYYEATSILRDAGKLGPHEYPAQVTRDQLEATKPDMGAKKWAALRDRLKAAMTPEEWASASRSTQYAHYTSKPVVQSMMKMLSRMGFKGGAILEPGAGIGVFPGLMPQEMATNSVYTGIEFDPITGSILKNLFPDERVLVESFIDSKLPTDYYDVGFGNPPFGDIPILSDPKYKKHGFLLHDYFFAKSIDSVKPGGLVVYVTSNGTMDKRGDKARAYLAERADLVGAIRMPQTAFKKNAGTEVVTDVLILRKKVKGETFPHAQEWLKSVPIKVGEQEFSINEYFVAHPEMVLGKHSSAGSMYAKDTYTVMPTEGDIDALFDKAAQSLPENIFAADRGSNAEAAKVRELDFNPKAKKEGNYYVSDAGVLMVREGGIGTRVDGKSEKDVAMLKDFVGLRDALKQAHYDQLNNGEWEISLKALQKSYRDFTKKHGNINQFTTYMQRVKVDELDDEGTPTGQKVWDEEQRYRYPLLTKLRDDPDWTLVSALEQVNEDEGTIKESPFLTERVLGKPEQKPAATPIDALLQVLNDIGHVDMATVADRLGIEQEDAIAALGPLVYQDPASGWVMADEYLSGNVRAKLKAAREAAKSDRRYERNVEALLSAQPADKTAADIKPQIGMSWIPEKVYEQFLREKTNLKAKVTFNERTGQWDVQVTGPVTLEAAQDWGTDKRNAADILQSALTGAPIRVTMTVGTGNDKKTVTDDAGTEAANAKLNQMREAFADWLWTDKERVDSLVPIYNDKFNNIVPRKFDGSHMTLPGISKRWSVFDHVKRGAWRIIQAGNTYLAHAVGSGKTFQMIISAMEQKRLGLVKKPMMVVPNHMLQQFAREWQDLYPAARLMVADEANFTGDNRRRFVARVATSDLDGVIITHSAFKLLDLDPEFKQKMIEQELDYLRAAMLEAGGTEEKTAKGKSKNRDPKVKQIEKKIERLEEKLKAAMSSEGKDKNVRFDETGVDMLYVDEAHEYRKLAFTTQRQVKGIDTNGSDKAFDLWMKVQWLRENKDPKRNLVMASGTPVTNTMAELYTTQRFMAPDVLAERGLEEFDQWASMFGAESTSIEPDASGKYGPVTRFNKFVNVGELTQMFREFADVLTSDYLAALLGDKRPKVKGGSRKINVTPKTDDYAAFQENDLKPRMESSRKWKPSRDEPNNPDPIIKIIGDGRLAAIDMRFIDPSLPNNPDSKLNLMIDEIIRVYKETADWEYKDKAGKTEPNKGAAQIVFSDLGFGEGVAKNRGFNARAWFEKRLRDAGVKPDHVAFMSDNKKSTAKIKLFRDINAGRVRIVVGSSKNMGTGVNAQQRLIALHHLDAPWYPADLEQREGRIIRQGNKNPEVEVYAYATKGSYDEQMWSTLARKQFFIDQALSGDPNIREIEDLGEASQFDIAAAMVADDPRVLQLAGIKAEIDKLRRLNRAHEDQRARMRQDYDLAALHIESAQKQLPDAEKAAAGVQDLSGSKFVAEADGKKYADRKEFGTALLAKFKELADAMSDKAARVGKVSGFDIAYAGQQTGPNGFTSRIFLMIPGNEPVAMAESPTVDPVGVAMRATNALASVAKKPDVLKQRIADSQAKMNSIEPRLNTPFPMKEMLLAKVQEADALEAEIVASGQAKEDAENALAEQAKEAAPAFDRGASGKMAAAELKRTIDRMASRLVNNPQLNVVQSVSELPFKAPADARGAFWDGKVWMVADNIKDMEEAREVYVHETMGHYGLRGFFGPMLDKELRKIFNTNPRVRKMATGWIGRNADLIETYKTKYRMTDADVQALATEEAMATIAQKGEKITGVKKLVAFIQSALRAMGLNRLANALESATDAEALTALYKAEMFVRDGRKLSGWAPRGFAPAMVAQSLADDLAEQEKWLMKEAKARGHKDIEDMLIKDYPAFEKLAAKWREMNPAEALLSRGADPSKIFGREIAPAAIRAYESLSGDAKRIVDGWNVNWDRGQRAITDNAEIRSAFEPVRAKLRELYGDTVPAYRGELQRGTASGDDRSLFSWSPIKDLALSYGINRTRGMPAEITQAQVDEQIANYRKHGIARMGGNKYVRRPMPEWLTDEPDYYYIYQGKEMITDGTDIAEELQRDKDERDEWRAELREKGKLYYADVPVDSIVWVPTGINLTHPEFIASYNPRKDSADGVRFSRQADDTPLNERVNTILANRAGSPAPLDAIAKAAVKMVRFDRLTGKVGQVAGRLLDRLTPEQVKAGVVSDYGIPENVIDRRAMLTGHLNVQTRKAGALIDKLSALTREESRVAYLWMNNNDPQAAEYFEKQLPDDSVKTLKEVKALIEKLSREAVDLGQLDPESYKRNSMEYLRRSYAKYTLDLPEREAAARASAVKILGDQYKGRGFTEEAEMSKVKAIAPEWWNRKLKAGQADKQLKGEKFIRLERRQNAGEGTVPMEGFGDRSRGKLLEVAYWPAGEPIPTKYAGWDEAGTFEVRDTKGPKVVFWRDYSAQERQAMGEIDEARFAIAKTLHGMIHDIEIGRYFDWVAKNYGKLVRTPEMGEVLEGKDLGWNSGLLFTKDQWVKVPDTKVQGTDVAKYGALAGRYLPAPIWNDVRQAHGQIKPFGETYAQILRMWKMSKTALSPAVHTNNVMSNFVMADWHDVTAGHVAKSLRIILAAHKRDGKALIGRAGNMAARAGIADREAAQAIMDRYQDSGGAIGTWASKELQNDQISPLIEALEKEMGLRGQSLDGDVGVYSALQHLMHARFRDAFTAMAGSMPGKYIGTEGQNLLGLYQAEDDVFRLAAWLKAKEEGASDMAAGKVSRRSFLDYSINAPWIQMMRNTGFPFISFVYRAFPMLLEIAQNKPWKLMKLAAFVGGLNALGYMLAGGDEDDERKYLPDEKAGKIWGAVPKLVRMPWNYANDSPVFLDIRRFVPVGDVFDIGATNAAVPIPPSAMPGGPLVILMEVLLNKSAFTGRDITLATDTLGEKAVKSFDHVWKGLMPNILGMPGTYATTGVMNAASGKTDAFGRELSVAQALGNTVGVKMGSYPKDVLQLNAQKKMQGEKMEIDHQINKLKREYQRKGLTYDEFMEKVRTQQDKKRKLIDEFQQKSR